MNCLCLSFFYILINILIFFRLTCNSVSILDTNSWGTIIFFQYIICLLTLLKDLGYKLLNFYHLMEHIFSQVIFFNIVFLGVSIIDPTMLAQLKCFVISILEEGTATHSSIFSWRIHGQRSLWAIVHVFTDSGTTEWLTYPHIHFGTAFKIN